MKIIINSHVKYEKPLYVLLESMVANKFNDWGKIILVVGGCDEDKEPCKLNVRHLFSKCPDIELPIIQTTFDNWEYTGYHMLYVYRENPLVKSDKYLFLMDTCTVNLKFPSTINKLEAFIPPNAKSNWVYGCQGDRASNIYLFSREVVLSYKENFGTKFTKWEAVQLEGNKSLIIKDHKVSGVRSFGTMFTAPERKQIRLQDIYDTGYPRRCMLYRCFNIIKWVHDKNKDDILQPKNVSP